MWRHFAYIKMLNQCKVLFRDGHKLPGTRSWGVFLQGHTLPHWPFSIHTPSGSAKLWEMIKTPLSVRNYRIQCPPELHLFSQLLRRHFKWKEIFSQDSKMTYSFREIFSEFHDNFGFFFHILIFVSLPHPTPTPSNTKRTTTPLPNFTWTGYHLGLGFEIVHFHLIRLNHHKASINPEDKPASQAWMVKFCSSISERTRFPFCSKSFCQ